MPVMTKDRQHEQRTTRSLRSDAAKSIKTRKLFPSDYSATKVIYLAIMAASKKWTMPVRNWKLAMNRFMIEFEDRLKDYVYIWQLHRIVYRLTLISVKFLDSFN